MQALVLDFGGATSRTMFETHDLTEAALGLPRGSMLWRGPFAPEGDALWRDMQAGVISERDYWLRRTSETGALVDKCWAEMQDFVKAARGAEPGAIVRTEFRDALKVAKAADLNLGILSNELDLFYGAEFRDKLPFLSQFDAILDATYTHILKPGARANLAICEQLDVSAEDCVFDDDQLQNVKGAIAVGMVPVHFDVMNPRQSYA